MGSCRLLIFAAPLLLAAPVHAQQTQDAAPPFSLPPTSAAPAPDPTRQGPELNVYRDQPRATPPVVAPTVIVPPAPAPSTQGAPATQPTPSRDAPARPAPDRPRNTQTVDRPAPVPVAPTPTATPSPIDPAPDPEPAPAASQPTPTPQGNAVEAPGIPSAPAVAASDGSIAPWIIGGALALVALIAALLWRRRRPVAPLATEDVAPAPAEPAQAEASQASEPIQAGPAPTPQPAIVEPAPATERPWIEMDLVVSQARYSMMGVTIAYSLILHNRGDRPAQDILVRGVVGNAGAQQQALLTAFFAGQDGMPLHSAVAIAPGETVQLAGELRLAADQIVPVDMGQRSLLIPLAAFDAAYRWGPDEGEPNGHGRTARAFIVGQEQEPPADRLSPFRLDQGPRQYRRAAARAAAELTPA